MICLNKCVHLVRVTLDKYPYHVLVFKASPCQSLREVFSIKERFNFNSSLMLSTKATFGLLDFTAEFLNSSVVLANVLALLLLVHLDEIVHNFLIKIFTT